MLELRNVEVYVYEAIYKTQTKIRQCQPSVNEIVSTAVPYKFYVTIVSQGIDPYFKFKAVASSTKTYFEEDTLKCAFLFN